MKRISIKKPIKHLIRLFYSLTSNCLGMNFLLTTAPTCWKSGILNLHEVKNIHYKVCKPLESQVKSSQVAFNKKAMTIALHVHNVHTIHNVQRDSKLCKLILTENN